MGIMTSDRIRHLQAMNNPAMATSIYPPAPAPEELPTPPVPQGQPVRFEPFPIDRIAEALDMPNYAPAKGAGANRSAIQSQRAFNPDGSDRQLATWDELAEWNKTDAVAGRKDPSTTIAWSKYGNSPEEAVEFLKKKMSADMGIEYESSPEEAPLPGEETLPPEVAAQNHRKARAGGGVGELKGLGGMSDLDRVKAMQDGIVTQDEINASRDRQQAATDARHGNFERLMLGQSDAERAAKPAARPAPLPPADPVQDQFDRQIADAKAYREKHGILPEEAPYVQWNEVDGQKVVARGPDGKPLKRADAGGRDSERAKNRFFQTVNRRWGEQAQRAGVDVRDLESAYDQAAAEGGHMAGVQAVNSMIDAPGGLRNARDLQLQANVNRRQEQIESTRAMRDPRRGAAMFHQSLASAQTPQDVMNTLMLAHYHQPNMGWGQAAMMIQRGEMDAKALSQWAQAQAAMKDPVKPTGPQAVAADVQASLQNINPGTVPALLQTAAQANPGAKPEMIQQWITNVALPAVQGLISQRRPLTNDEKALIRTVIPQPPYLREFAQQVGIDEKDPQVVALYKDIYGVEPRWAPVRWAWDQMANMINGPDNQGQAQAAGK